VREFYQARLQVRGVSVGWGRDKRGAFFSEFARDAQAAWEAAQSEVRARIVHLDAGNAALVTGNHDG